MTTIHPVAIACQRCPALLPHRRAILDAYNAPGRHEDAAERLAIMVHDGGVTEQQAAMLLAIEQAVGADGVDQYCRAVGVR